MKRQSNTGRRAAGSVQQGKESQSVDDVGEARGRPASESLFRHFHAGLAFAELMAEEVDGQKYARDLRAKMQAAAANDLRQYEMMLAAQADTLDAIFSSLTYQAAGANNAPQFQLRLTLALKAQAQCRATVEALAEIKNPRPVAFIKQANVAAGHQQVNNGVAPRARPRRKAQTSNELLERSDGERLDGRATGEASGGNQTLEAMGAVHRPIV